MNHGGNIKQAKDRYGFVIDDWLDLSTGINPHAWGTGTLANLVVENDLTRLLDTASQQLLVDSVSKICRAPVTLTVVATPGTQAGLSWMANLAPEGDAAIVAPTYTGHREAWTAVGRPLRNIANLSGAGDATTVILVNPDNPRWKTAFAG
ncbi:hypothetical protein [Breoghania sp.]|uniref:hypothetical protein n=1 Tax=Breoghania sp. TaxID=2065378 RepID=UPI00260F9DC2|nr:hypothetical protein [Breoghania sp.]MDJ0930781.1 hypothetical protein [Breoghania sp.]